MDRLKSLQREYEKNAKQLDHPLDLAELQQLKERRRVILAEARLLAKTMNLSGPQRFSLAV